METECHCDYSYTCEACQQKIDRENQQLYRDELDEWIKNTILALAKKLGVEVDDPPKMPGRYRY